MPLDVVFFGTPEPAATALDRLLRSSHRVRAVVTAPDRRRGRGLVPAPSPVKVRAVEAGLGVLQPATLGDEKARARLAELPSDAFVVTAYGRILPKPVLVMPRLGCVNLHFSLLPRFRGAAPVQRALIEGGTETGVTIMQMDSGLDTGPILAQETEPIRPDDTGGSIESRLAVRGADLLISVLDSMERGETVAVPQNNEEATYASKISTAEERIDWTEEAARIVGRIRAFDPRPGAWTMLRDRRLKVWRAVETQRSSDAPPGTIEPSGPGLVVNTGSSKIALIEVQPEGKRRMSAEEFVRGYRPSPPLGGERFDGS